MAVVIRLARHGAKKHPYYHIVVTDSRAARNAGTILERIGSYDPMQAKDSGKRVTLDADKAKSWMAKGAKPSDRVHKFMAAAGIVTAKPIPVQTKKNQQSEKTQMRIKDKADKLAKAEEARLAAEAEAKAAAETPVEAPAEEVATEEVVTEPTVEAEPVAEAPAVEETSAE